MHQCNGNNRPLKHFNAIHTGITPGSSGSGCNLWNFQLQLTHLSVLKSYTTTLTSAANASYASADVSV